MNDMTLAAAFQVVLSLDVALERRFKIAFLVFMLKLLRSIILKLCQRVKEFLEVWTSKLVADVKLPFVETLFLGRSYTWSLLFIV